MDNVKIMLSKKIYLKFIAASFLLLATCYSAFAQTYTVTPTLIGSTGNYTFVPGFGSISSSVGEPVVTTVSSGSVTLTQGFQQPDAAQSFSVSVFPPNTTICAGTSVSLNTMINPFSPPYTYSWNPTSGLSCFTCSNPVATPLSPGTTTYTVTVNNSTYTTTATVTVTVKPSPTATVSGTDSICLGNSATLFAFPSGGVTYSWSTIPVQNTQSISVTPSFPGPNSYSVTVTNSFGCTATASHTVNVSPAPVVAIASTATNLCSGQSATLTASGGSSYTWNTSPIQTSPSIVVSPSATTPYSVFVTNSSGCSGAASVTVTVNSVPTPAINTNTTSICLGYGSAVLTASGGQTYSWLPGGSTAASITVSSIFFSGNYTYTVTAFNGSCSADTSITITVLPLPSISATSSNTTMCLGDTVALTANIPTGALGYSWSGYGLNQNPIYVSPTSTTNYTATGMGLNGCGNQTSITEYVSSISVSAGSDLTICPGFTAQLFATAGGDTTGLSYEWFINSWDTLIPNSNSAAISVSPHRNPTLYIAGAYNSYGCWNKDTMTVFFETGGACEIHIYNGITPNGDSHNDTWVIDGILSFPDNNISIFNRWGDKVWAGKNYDNVKVVWRGQNQQGQNLPDGTYYYVIELFSDRGTITYSKWVEVTR